MENYINIANTNGFYENSAYTSKNSTSSVYHKIKMTLDQMQETFKMLLILAKYLNIYLYPLLLMMMYMCFEIVASANAKHHNKKYIVK